VADKLAKAVEAEAYETNDAEADDANKAIVDDAANKPLWPTRPLILMISPMGYLTINSLSLKSLMLPPRLLEERGQSSVSCA
jgi:hypothetical protein